jgi:hypothetical protein
MNHDNGGMCKRGAVQVTVQFGDKGLRYGGLSDGIASRYG